MKVKKRSVWKLESRILVQYLLIEGHQKESEMWPAAAVGNSGSISTTLNTMILFQSIREVWKSAFLNVEKYCPLWSHDCLVNLPAIPHPPTPSTQVEVKMALLIDNRRFSNDRLCFWQAKAHICPSKSIFISLFRISLTLSKTWSREIKANAYGHGKWLGWRCKLMFSSLLPHRVSLPICELRLNLLGDTHLDKRSVFFNVILGRSRDESGQVRNFHNYSKYRDDLISNDLEKKQEYSRDLSWIL